MGDSRLLAQSEPQQAGGETEAAEEVTAAPSRLGVGGGGGEPRDSVRGRDKAF